MVTTGSSSALALTQERGAISASVHPAPIDIRQAMNAPGQSLSPFLSFGRFRLHPRQRLLLEDGRPVSVGGHALDLLIALSERPGEIVNKHELVARLWPGLTVEESNLRVQVAALRRSLRDRQAGQRYISTVNGRGYCFVAPVVHHCKTDQNILPRDAKPMSISPRMPANDRELRDSIAEGLSGRPLVAVVNDAALSRRFSEMLAAYQLDTSAFGVALLFIPGATPSLQEQEQTGIHKA